MVAFGLLERSGEGYAVTSLAKRLIKPLPGEEKELLKSSFLNVSLYQEVYDAFLPDGKLPESLGTRLERQFGMAEDMGDYAARILRESGVTAGLFGFDDTYILDPSDQTYSDDSRIGSLDAVPEPAKLKFRVNPAHAEVGGQGPEGTLTLELPRPFAKLTLQNSVTPEERAKLERWILSVVIPQIEFLEVIEE